MISKEKLLKGYIKNDTKQGGELFNKWKEACLFHGFSYEWMRSGNIDTTLGTTEGCYIDRFEDFNGCGDIEAFLGVAPEYAELTLEDFEEEGKEEILPTKYKYVPVEVESIFDLREMFESGELYFEDANQGDDQGMVNIGDESTLVNLLAGKDAIYTCKEVTLQDKVEDFMKSVTTEGYWAADYSIHVENKQYHLTESDFFEMCRLALRANGELK